MVPPMQRMGAVRCLVEGLRMRSSGARSIQPYATDRGLEILHEADTCTPAAWAYSEVYDAVTPVE
eukprot:6412240-Prymnesium_polylepis.1